MLGSTRRAGMTIAGVLAVASLFGAASASASEVQREFGGIAIFGDPDNDAITLSTNGTTMTVVDTGTGGVNTLDPECTEVNPTTVTCPVSVPGEGVIRSFFVDLASGVDSFTNQNFEALQSQISGGSSTGAKTIAGGPGQQLILGGVDGDQIDGGSGDDFLTDGSGPTEFGTGGNDLLVGGDGNDEVQYGRQTGAPLTVTLDGLANDGEAGEADNVQAENVTTGFGNDVVVGDAGANALRGGPGNDLLRGLGGNDELFGDDFGGGIGAMAIRGAVSVVGNDTLDGGAGRDSLDCGRGFDLALREPLDEVGVDCERTGAEVVGDTAGLSGKKKNKFKVELLCPESEVKACAGKLKVTAAGKKAGKGKFSVAAGQTKKAKAKLTKKGLKALRKAGGSLLVTVTATTDEPGGVTQDSGRILIHK